MAVTVIIEMQSIETASHPSTHACCCLVDGKWLAQCVAYLVSLPLLTGELTEKLFMYSPPLSKIHEIILFPFVDCCVVGNICSLASIACKDDGALSSLLLSLSTSPLKMTIVTLSLIPLPQI